MIAIELQGDAKKIQREFEMQLSEKEILKTTAFALNTTARRVEGFVKREVKQKYTVDKKYLNKDFGKLTRPASGKQDGLYAELSFSYAPTPMIGFKHSKNGKRGGIQIEIKKGSQKLLKHAFIATMKSGHIGIYQRGSYQGGKFVPSKEKTASGKSRITQLKTVSPFNMALSREVESKTAKYVSEQLPKRLAAMLRQKAIKLSKK